MKKEAGKEHAQTEADTHGIPRNGSSEKSATNNLNSNSEGELKVYYSDKCPIAILEDGKDFWPIIANQKISKIPYKSKEEIEKRIQRTDWEFIGSVCVTLIKNIVEQRIIDILRQQDLINRVNQ